MSRALRHILLASCLVAALSGAQAANFGVSPIRLDLGRDAKTGSLVVNNDDPEKALEMRAKLFEWTQDADGNDRYAESDDLVYFPRIFAVEKQDRRIIRVGLKAPALASEKAYRLFIEEVPPAKGSQIGGAQVFILLRFGIPIFVRPDKERLGGEIDRVEPARGGAAVVIRNSGNVNFQILSLKVSSRGFVKQVVGGYALAGASKRIEIQIPRDICRQTNRLQVSLVTDRIGTLERAFDWDARRCSPQ